jgi:putative DNA primase/helicase
MNLTSIAHTLGGEVSNGQVLCPGPGHSRADRSLSIRIGKDGRLLHHSFSSDPFEVCDDYIRSRLGLPGWKPVGSQRRQRVPNIPRAQEARQDEPLKFEGSYAECLWKEGRNPKGTLVETYLRGRCLELPFEDCPRFIRFHPRCPFKQEHFPALISLIRNIETDKPQAIQRTALNPDGTAVKRDGKTFRKTLGPAKGGAIKIDDDASVTQGLCVGEGLETCLAGRQMGFAPAWSLLSAGGIENFPVLNGLEGLTVFLENDVRSREAAEKCFERYRAAGREVVIQKSTIGSDLNNAIRGAA